MRARVAALANVAESREECLVRSVDVQRDDVQRMCFPTRRELRAVDERERRAVRRLRRFGEAGGVVVVGEGQDVDAAREGVSNQRLRSEQAVGGRGMGMQIEAGHWKAADACPILARRLRRTGRPVWCGSIRRNLRGVVAVRRFAVKLRRSSVITCARPQFSQKYAIGIAQP